MYAKINPDSIVITKFIQLFPLQMCHKPQFIFAQAAFWEHFIQLYIYPLINIANNLFSFTMWQIITMIPF